MQIAPVCVKTAMRPPLCFSIASSSFPRRAIERLPVTFPTFKHVFEIAMEQGLILFRMLLGCFFKRQTFHYADAAFTKRVSCYEGRAGEFGERSCSLNRARKIAGIDRAELFRGECSGRSLRLLAAFWREWRVGVSAEAAFGIALRLAVTNKNDVGG